MAIQNKIDFVLLLTATNCNPNGDPLNGNHPRVNYDGYGEISDVCIKRKIRNRMQDLGNKIFVQSDDKRADEYGSLKDRAEAEFAIFKDDKATKPEEIEKLNSKKAKLACEKWLDVRSFGQVFAYKSKGSSKDKDEKEEKDKKGDGVSIGIRGPVSIHQAVSCSPLFVNSMQITKSVNSEPSDKGGKASNTMGMKHMVNFGLYEVKGSINVQLAEKTGFSDEDAEVIKECLRTLFINDTSAARPDGSMEVVRLYWWKHNCKDGQYSSARVHRSVVVTPKTGVDFPKSIDDYDIALEPLEGLEPEVISGS